MRANIGIKYRPADWRGGDVVTLSPKLHSLGRDIPEALLRSHARRTVIAIFRLSLHQGATKPVFRMANASFPRHYNATPEIIPS